MDEKFKLLSTLEDWISELLYNYTPDTAGWIEEIQFVPPEVEDVSDAKIKIMVKTLQDTLLEFKRVYEKPPPPGIPGTKVSKFNRFDPPKKWLEAQAKLKEEAKNASTG